MAATLAAVEAFIIKRSVQWLLGLDFQNKRVVHSEQDTS